MALQFPLAELRALFRSSPAFRQVLLADIATQCGDGGLLIAFPLLIMARTHDVTLTGLAFSGETLAFGLLSPLAGAVADRVAPKPLMIAANLGRVLLFALLLAGLSAGLPTPGFLALSVALGAVGAFFMPARAAFVRRLLEGEALQQAIAIEGTLGFLLRLIAPPLMGLLLAVYPAEVGLQVDMACYALAVALLAPGYVTGPAPRGDGEAPGAWHEGWQVIGRDRSLATLLVLDTVLSAVGMAAYAITVALLDTVLHLPPQANAWIIATTGFAGALGAQLAGRLGRVRGATTWLVGAIALSYLLVPCVRTLPLLLAVWSLRGLAIGVFCVLVNQRIAQRVGPQVIGRVQAAWGLAACLAAFGGSVATPWLLRHVGASASYTVFGLVLAGCVGVMVGGRVRWVPSPGRPHSPV